MGPASTHWHAATSASCIGKASGARSLCVRRSLSAPSSVGAHWARAPGANLVLPLLRCRQIEAALQRLAPPAAGAPPSWACCASREERGSVLLAGGAPILCAHRGAGLGCRRRTPIVRRAQHRSRSLTPTLVGHTHSLAAAAFVLVPLRLRPLTRGRTSQAAAVLAHRSRPSELEPPLGATSLAPSSCRTVCAHI